MSQKFYRVRTPKNSGERIELLISASGRKRARRIGACEIPQVQGKDLRIERVKRPKNAVVSRSEEKVVVVKGSKRDDTVVPSLQ